MHVTYHSENEGKMMSNNRLTYVTSNQKYWAHLSIKDHLNTSINWTSLK